VKGAIEQELRARRSLVDRSRSASLDLVYIPARPELGVRHFYIQRKLVTNEEYAKFVHDGGYDDGRYDLWDAQGTQKLPSLRDASGQPGPRNWKDGTWTGRAEDPVRGITIHEARAYARWLSRRGGYTRLPTAAEWEVAAGYDPARRLVRGYPWGEAFDADSLRCGAKELPEQGMKGHSPLGLLDATGLLRQWVEVDSTTYGTKGSEFSATEAEARDLARVKHTETIQGLSVAEMKAPLLKIGFRLVRDVDH
jgi:iron(II)-dependent oxidoreductase